MKVDKHIIDLREIARRPAIDPEQADTPLEFTPEETPDIARAWLALERYKRDTEAATIVPSILFGADK